MSEFYEQEKDMQKPTDFLHAEIEADGSLSLCGEGEEHEEERLIKTINEERPRVLLAEPIKKEFVTKSPTEHLKEFMKPELLEELEEILEEHKEIFSKSKTDIGLAEGVEHDIELYQEQNLSGMR